MVSRKHTPEQTSNEQETATSGTAVLDVPAADAPTDLANLPPSDTNGDGPAFADKVGQKSYAPIPDPFGIAKDYVAGVHLMESRRDRQMAIMFGEGRPEDKPSQEVIDKMKEAGYRWNPSHKIWTHPVRFESAMTTRIEAERLYQDVCAMIRQEKGIEGDGKTPSF